MPYIYFLVPVMALIGAFTYRSSLNYSIFKFLMMPDAYLSVLFFFLLLDKYKENAEIKRISTAIATLFVVGITIVGFSLRKSTWFVLDIIYAASKTFLFIVYYPYNKLRVLTNANTLSFFLVSFFNHQ